MPESKSTSSSVMSFDELYHLNSFGSEYVNEEDDVADLSSLFQIYQRFVENVSMRQSAIISNATSNIPKDLLSQTLQLLSGVDILGNVSRAREHMSTGVAAMK